jgi:hypothetical protein
MTKSQSNGNEDHVYELKKIKLSQDKDGYTVTLRLHHTDQGTDLVRQPVGAVFSGTLKFENYVEVT